MHAPLVLLQVMFCFGFKCATSNIAMVPNNANIVDIHLVFLHLTISFGFIFASINTTMVPSYANIVYMHLV